MALPMNCNAKLSRCNQYRYMLTRRWDDALQSLGIICLNPSTADAKTDDNTVRKCVALTAHWGYGGFVLVNLFAWRATDKTEIRNVVDPVGPNNDAEIQSAIATVDDILLAWGNDGAYLDRSSRVRSMLARRRKNYLCIRQNASGEPIHPLYQSSTADCQPIDLNY